MNILSEEFESGIRIVVREQFKESYTDFLSHGTAEKRWLSIVSAAHYADCSSNTICKWFKMGLNLYKTFNKYEVNILFLRLQTSIDVPIFFHPLDYGIME